jgi:hypothetical protein
MQQFKKHASMEWLVRKVKGHMYLTNLGTSRSCKWKLMLLLRGPQQVTTLCFIYSEFMRSMDLILNLCSYEDHMHGNSMEVSFHSCTVCFCTLENYEHTIYHIKTVVVFLIPCICNASFCLKAKLAAVLPHFIYFTIRQFWLCLRVGLICDINKFVHKHIWML